MPLLFVGFWAATRHWSLPVFLVSATFASSLGFGFFLANPAALTFVGNPQVLVAAVCVLGFRWPALWAFPPIGVLPPNRQVRPFCPRPFVYSPPMTGSMTPKSPSSRA